MAKMQIRGEELMSEGQWQERKQRACWTSGETEHIAAWCRKGGNSNVYAIDEDDSENVEEHLTIMNTCKHGTRLSTSL